MQNAAVKMAQRDPDQGWPPRVLTVGGLVVLARSTAASDLLDID
jgi:hypothetical protein